MNQEMIKSILQDVEAFLRQVAVMQPENLEREGALIHDAAKIHADFVEAILEDME